MKKNHIVMPEHTVIIVNSLNYTTESVRKPMTMFDTKIHIFVHMLVANFVNLTL